MNRRGTLRFKLLLALALTIVVGWSVLWFVAATVVDRQVERMELAAAETGTVLTCANRSVKGFPFRIEVRCGSNTRVGNRDATVTVGGLTLAALIYNPARVIAEARGPLTLTGSEALPVEATWRLAHASTRLDLSGASVLRLDAEVLEPTVRVAGGAAVVARDVDLNLRRAPDAPADLDVAVALRDLVPLGDGEAADVGLRGRVEGGAALLQGRPEALMARAVERGLTVRLDAATLESGTMAVLASGTLTLGVDGRLDGTVEIAVAGHEGRVPYLDALAPGAADTVEAFLHNGLAYAPETTIGDRKARRVVLTITDGRVTAGFVPLFTLPALAVAAR